MKISAVSMFRHLEDIFPPTSFRSLFTPWLSSVPSSCSLSGDVDSDIFTATNISCNHSKLTSEALNCISHDQRHQRAFDFMLSVRALAFEWNTMKNSCPRKSEKTWKSRQLFKTPIITPKEVEQKIDKNRTTTEKKDGKQKIIMFHCKMHRETVDFRNAIFSWYEKIRL